MNYLAIFALLVGTAFASPEEFYEKNGHAIEGYDPVTYFTDKGPQPGSETITAVYRNSTFRFVSEKNKSDFLKSPEKFSPQYNGFCAFGMAGGYKAKIDPTAYQIVNGKLYLNYDKSVQKKWIADRDDFIEKANQNWPSVKLSSRTYQ